MDLYRVDKVNCAFAKVDPGNATVEEFVDGIIEGVMTDPTVIRCLELDIDSVPNDKKDDLKRHINERLEEYDRTLHVWYKGWREKMKQLSPRERSINAMYSY